MVKTYLDDCFVDARAALAAFRAIKILLSRSDRRRSQILLNTLSKHGIVLQFSSKRMFAFEPPILITSSIDASRTVIQLDATTTPVNVNLVSSATRSREQDGIRSGKGMVLAAATTRAQTYAFSTCPTIQVSLPAYFHRSSSDLAVRM